VSRLRAALSPAPKPCDDWQLAGDVVAYLILAYIVVAGVASLVAFLRSA